MLSRRGQSVVEYTIIVGIITVVLYYMGTGIKRGVQTLVKVTADQVGNQQNADQDFNDTQEGYLVCSTTDTQGYTHKQTTELGYIPVSGVPNYTSTVAYNDYSDTITNTITNGGFTPSQPE